MHYSGGNYYSAYEACFYGFRGHRTLTGPGIKNIVVNPADRPTMDKERKQKEDARDSGKIRLMNRNWRTRTKRPPLLGGDQGVGTVMNRTKLVKPAYIARKTHP